MNCLELQTGFRICVSVIEKHLLRLAVTFTRSEFQNLNQVPSDRIAFRRFLSGETESAFVHSSQQSPSPSEIFEHYVVDTRLICRYWTLNDVSFLFKYQLNIFKEGFVGRCPPSLESSASWTSYNLREAGCFVKIREKLLFDSTKGMISLPVEQRPCLRPKVLRSSHSVPLLLQLPPSRTSRRPRR